MSPQGGFDQVLRLISVIWMCGRALNYLRKNRNFGFKCNLLLNKLGLFLKSSTITFTLYHSFCGFFIDRNIQACGRMIRYIYIYIRYTYIIYIVI
jgi:hypothetical protein